MLFEAGGRNLVNHRFALRRGPACRELNRVGGPCVESPDTPTASSTTSSPSVYLLLSLSLSLSPDMLISTDRSPVHGADPSLTNLPPTTLKHDLPPPKNQQHPYMARVEKIVHRKAAFRPLSRRGNDSDICVTSSCDVVMYIGIGCANNTSGQGENRN
jgi:hypothetical protein